MMTPADRKTLDKAIAAARDWSPAQIDAAVTKLRRRGHTELAEQFRVATLSYRSRSLSRAEQDMLDAAVDGAWNWSIGRVDATVAELRRVGADAMANQFRDRMQQVRENLQADADEDARERRLGEVVDAVIEAAAVRVAADVLMQRQLEAEQIEVRRLAAEPPHVIRAELAAMSRTDGDRYRRTREALAGHVPISAFR